MEANLFKKEKKVKPERKINYYLDDKGRKIYDTSKLSLNVPKPPEKETKDNVKEELTYLKHRDKVEVTADPVTPKINDKEKPSAFYCKVCNASLKDNQAYLDHLNGKRHNQLLGMNMKVEKVGVDKVREKLLNLKRQAEKPMKTKKDLEKKVKESELEKLANEDK